MIHVIDSILYEGVSKAKELYLETGKVDSTIFNDLVNLDPTPQKKYIEWMCKVFISDNITGANLNLFTVLPEFEKLIAKKIITGADSDINRYKTLEQLVDKVNQNRDTKTKGEQEKEVKVEGTDVVLDNSKCRVYRIHTREASCIYGSGTKWCTAATSSSNYFDRYYFENGVNLYYIIPKGDLLQSVGKYAVAVHPSGNKEVYNAADSRVGSTVFQQVCNQLDIKI